MNLDKNDIIKLLNGRVKTEHSSICNQMKRSLKKDKKHD